MTTVDMLNSLNEHFTLSNKPVKQDSAEQNNKVGLKPLLYGKLRKEHLKPGMTIYFHDGNSIRNGVVVELRTDILFKVETEWCGKKEIKPIGYASDYYDDELRAWQDLSDELYNSYTYAEKRISELESNLSI